ncbi:MAG TPA: hypothetical protein VJK04_02690 [Candidatus Paceibacterota bacterium]
MAGDPHGRTELIARQDWATTKEANMAREAGIGFGFELKGAPKNFNPHILNGLPYSIHAPNEILTQLYKAATEGDEKFVAGFWNQIAMYVKLNPRPVYVVFHGAGLGEVPPINEHRFALTIDSEEWLARAKWHESIFTRMREVGLTQAVLETVYLCNYYGPPYAMGWLPITYLSPRVGIYNDMLNITKAAGVGSVVDLEHLQMTCQSLSRVSIELDEMDNMSLFAASKPASEFQRYFGFCAERNKIPIGLHSSWVELWQGMVYALNTPYYHVGGISKSQVVEVSKEETVASGYHQALLNHYQSDSYMAFLIRCRRVGSHASVRQNDVRLRSMLTDVFHIARHLSEPAVFVLETSNKGEQNPDCWYWSRPDALESSLSELRKIVSIMV